MALQSYAIALRFGFAEERTGMMNMIQRCALAAVCSVLVACVTVNVYFPEAAAEKAADRLIREIYGREAPTGPEAGDEQSDRGRAQTPLAIRVLDWIIPVAHAQAPDINIATPAINRLKAAMTQRHRRLVTSYTSGAIGMANNGMLTVRDAKAIPIRDRNPVKQLVAEENRDRNALYGEVAKANGHPEWVPRIRDIFARRWVGNAPGGWWFQDSNGNWQQK